MKTVKTNNSNKSSNNPSSKPSKTPSMPSSLNTPPITLTLALSDIRDDPGASMTKRGIATSVCPVCHKEFSLSLKQVIDNPYRLGKSFVCSWKCFLGYGGTEVGNKK